MKTFDGELEVAFRGQVDEGTGGTRDEEDGEDTVGWVTGRGREGLRGVVLMNRGRYIGGW
jgi:hypothetical protein